jgi:hypothetical protein
LLGQFADCLATTLAEGSGSPPPAEPAAEAPIAAAPSPAAPAAEAPTAAAPPARPRRSADAIDLLQVTGISAMARKAAPYVIGFVVGGLVTWALISLFG